MRLLIRDVLIRTINIDRKSPRGFQFSLMPPKLSFVHPITEGRSDLLRLLTLGALLACFSSCKRETGRPDSGFPSKTEQTEKAVAAENAPSSDLKEKGLHSTIVTEGIEEISQDTASANGPPSDQTVRHAAWSMNTTYMDKPFKRGQVLESLGGGGVAAGTVLYPIKIEDFPFPIYLSRDEFGDWRFNIGEKNTLYEVRTPTPPETDEARRQRELELRQNAEEERMVESVRQQAQAEAKIRQESEFLRKRQAEELAERKKEEEMLQSDRARAQLERRDLAESNRLGAEERMRQREEQDRTLAREMEETRRKLAQGSKPSEKEDPDETTKGMPITPTPKVDPSEPEVSRSPDKAIRIAEAKAELTSLESRIAAERQRFRQATDIINRLTNFKKTPVKEGSSAYHQCMEASRVIQDVEQKAPGMTSERIRIATLLTELERN